MKEKYFIEAKVKKIDKDIEKAIKKSGITYPHHSLAFFKATYAKFEEANGNGVILANDVKDDVKYLIGTQMNRDHLREGYVMGSIIDAYVTDNDEIEVIFKFYKTVYAKEYELALDLMKKDKLTVSFELMVDKKNVQVQANGNRRLTNVEFDGVGLLFGLQPAYKNAYVLETAMRIIEDAFNQKDKSLVFAAAKDVAKKWARIGELIEGALIEKEEASYQCECLSCGKVFTSEAHCKDAKCPKCGGQARRKNRPGAGQASQDEMQNNIDEKTLDKNENLTKDKTIGGEKTMDEKARQALLTKFKEEVTKELGEEAVKDWSDEKWEEELAKRANTDEQTEEETSEASKSEAEESTKEEETSEESSKEDAPKEETSEEENSEEAEKQDENDKDTAKEETEEASEDEKVDAEKRNSKVSETRVYDVTEDSEAGTMEVIETIVTQVEEDGKEVKNEQVIRHTVYTQAQLDAVKASYEETITSKDEEIKNLTAKVSEYEEKEKAEKVSAIRDELGDFAKDLSDDDLFDADKVEIARLKKKIADLETKKATIVASKNEDNLETGHQEDNDDEDNKEELQYARKKYVKSKVK